MRFVLIYLIVFVFSIPAWSADEVESLYDRFEEKQIKQINTNLNKKRKKTSRGKKDNIGALDKIYSLEPLKDIAVIQRKFLPRTGRFEVSLNFLGSLNNAFFSTLGGTGQIAYYFDEHYGVELQYYSLTGDAKDVTRRLRDENIAPLSLVAAKSYLGASFVYTPIYGKMGLLNKKIVPFDLYFSAGAGTTETTAGDQAPTLHFGSGQIFGLNKNWAYRWDFALNVYAYDDSAGASQVQNDLFLSVGISYYFPDVSYR